MHIYTILKTGTVYLKNAGKRLSMLAVLFLLAGSAFAQVPVNDDPCNGATISATTLTPAATCTYAPFTNVDASATTGAGIPVPTCANFTDADVWFTATVPVGANAITVDTKGLTMQDGGMAIYTATGTCPNLTLTQVNCDDNSSANFLMPKLTVSGPAGTVFYIRFWGIGGEQGTFGICVTSNTVPPNDDCTNATSLTVNPDYLCGATTNGTTANATQSSNLPVPTCGNAAGINDDVWYSFVATGTGHRVSLSNVSGGTNMTFAVYSGTCTNLTQIACATTNTVDLTGLTPNATYYVRVYTNAAVAATTASFTICVGTAPPPPANDDCPGAVNLTVNPDLNCGVTTAGTTVSATQSTSTPLPTCGTANGWNDDVWFTFTATQTSHRVSLLNILPAATSMTMQVYSGTCGALVAVPGGCANANILNLTGLNIGTVYHVRVYTNVTTAATNASFNICVGSFPPPPANDECTGAVSLTVNADQLCAVTTAGTTYGSTQSATTPNPTCGTANGWNDDVWFSFVATGTTHRITLSNVAGDATNMTIAAYSGTCAALTQVGCANANVLNLTGLTPNATYYVRVYTNVATAQTYATFTICVGTPPPPPVNDDPCGAIQLTVAATCSYQNFSTEAATNTTGAPAPGCANYNGGDIWFKVTVPASGNLAIDTHGGGTGGVTDGGMAIYSGTCSGLTLIACDDDSSPGGGLMPYIIRKCTTGLTPGATIWIRFWSYGNNSPGIFGICVTDPSIVGSGPGAICGTANSFCTSQTYTYPSTTNVPSLGGGGIYGCLGTTPNPAFYYMQIQTTGNLTFNITQVPTAGGNGDVDFAIWGPFTSLTDGCTQLNALCPTITPTDCSYSIAATETVHLPNAQAGQFYIIIITNYSNQPGTITFNQTAGPGTTNCNIVCNATATNSGPACPGGTFNLFGSSSIGGATFSWTGPNGFTSNQQNPVGVVAPATAGSYIYTLTVTSGANTCTGTTTVVVGQPPAPTATSPVNYCQNATAVPLTATGTNLLWYTTPTGGIGSTTAPTPSTATVGTTTYYVSQTFAPCESPRTPIVVNVGAPSPAPTVSTPVTYCQGATAVPLTATGSNILWYTTPTGGVGSATAPTPSTATAGNTTYYVTQTVGTGCESPRASITVVVNPTPAAPTVTSPVNYCQNAQAATLTATGTNLLWYTTATGGTGSATAPTPSTTTVGTTIYYVSSTIGTCEGPRAAIVVNVGALPAAPTVTSPVTYCQGATAVPLTATGTNLLWYTVATGGIGSATAPTPSTAVSGSTTYYVSSSNNGCEGPRAAIVVTVNITPGPPEVFTPVIYCQGATAIPLSPSGANILWYTTATGGTGSTTPPTPSTASAGNTVYYVSQSNGSCEGPRSAVTVTVNPTPAAPVVTSPVNYCQNATAVPLTATGTNLLWYTTATGGTGSATAPTPSTTTPGSTTYYVSATTGSCEGPRAAIVVNVGAPPAAPTVTSPVTYCQNATAVPLTATGTNLLWYTTATGGTGSATAPTPSTTTPGSTTYYVSQSNNGCESPRAAIVVNVSATPPPPEVVSPVTYCQGATAVPLSPSGANLLWYTTATGGTGSTTPPTPSTATAGNTIYYVSQLSGSCEGPRASVTVIINPAPAAPAVTSPVTYCQGATAGPLTATGTGILWYNTATGGTGSSTAPTPSTANPGSTIYYVSQTSGSCEGPRASITVVVSALPAAPAVTSPVNYCKNDVAVPLTATGTNLLWYATATGGTGSATAPTPSTATVGSTTYYVSQTVSTCEGARAAIVVNISNPPGAPEVASPLTYCQNSTAPALTASGSNLHWYTTATGGQGSTTAPVPSTTTVGSTTYYVSQTTGSCEGARAAITVVITPALIADAGSPVTIASGQQTQLNGSGTPGANYLWTANGPLALTSATILNPIANPLQTTTYTLTVSDPTSLCPSASSNVIVTVVTTCINVRNAFTPNGDGINDTWFVYDQNFCLRKDGVLVNVYNRYGSKVFESQNYTNNWDGTYKGKPVPDGTYYAVIEFTLANGAKQYVRTDLTVLR